MQINTVIKKISIILFSVCASLALSNQVFAGPDHQHKVRVDHKHKHMHAKLKPMMRALSHLDLSDTQKQEIKTLKMSLKDNMKPQHKQAKTLKKQLYQVLKQEQIDESQVIQLKIQLAEIEAQQMIAMRQFKTQTVALLTEPQKKKLSEMKEKRQKKMKHQRTES